MSAGPSSLIIEKITSLSRGNAKMVDDAVSSSDAPSFQQLAKIEPGLVELLVACEQIPDEACGPIFWYDEIKPRLLNLVGWGASGSGIIASSHAYDVAYDTCYSALPKCFRRCYRCGKEVPNELSFDGSHPRTKDISFQSLPVCFVASLDMLGFKERIQNAVRHERLTEALYGLRRALEGAFPFIDETSAPWKVKTYSDNFLVHYEFDRITPVTFDPLCSGIAWFQLAMILQGQAIRGGLTLGRNFVDDRIAFGPALLEAHEIESNVARTPRVVLSSTVRLLVAYFLMKSTLSDYLASREQIVVDSDGAWFVDYMSCVTGRTKEYPLDKTAIVRHGCFIKEQLALDHNDEGVRRKYEWMAAYHDMSCCTINCDELSLRIADVPSPRTLTVEDLEQELTDFKKEIYGRVDLDDDALALRVILRLRNDFAAG